MEKSYASQVLKKVGENLYRNGEGNYIGIVRVKGKQHKKSLKTTDKGIAQRRLVELKDKLQRLPVANPDEKKITFKDLSTAWLASIEPNLKAAAYRRRKVSLNGLLPHLGSLSVRLIGQKDVGEWHMKRGKKLKPRTHNIELETLNQIFRYAIDRGIILDSPAAKIKRKKQTQAKPLIPDQKDFAALLKVLHESPQAVHSGAADMVEFLAYSGMRVAEAANVLVKDITEKGVKITGGEYGTKNHEERVIPINPGLKTVIDRVLAQKEKGYRGKIFDIQSPRGAMILAFKRNPEIQRFRVHDLRHFFASYAIERNINFQIISEWLGHKDGGFLVAQVYGHLRKEFENQEAAKMTFAF